MKKASMKFHFNGEYTDYTKCIGELCPDKYDYTPRVGDTVRYVVKFMGVAIEKGVVVGRVRKTKRLAAILEKLNDFVRLDSEDNEYLSRNFDFEGYSDPNSNAGGFFVEFSEKLSRSFVKRVLGELGEYPGGCDLSSGKIKAKVFGGFREGYYLKVRLKGFFDGFSVISTKEMDSYKELHARSTRVENVAWSDRVFSSSLLSGLNESLDEICKNEPEDYHPGSGKVVRDIVHPSMYCYVKGVSQVKGVPGNPLAAGVKVKEGRVNDKDFWGRDYEESVYQWLPAEFSVSDQGSVRIDSYVNNLDRSKYPGMYTLIEQMFERILPMFEAVCSSLRNDFNGVDGSDLGRKAIPLRGRTLQVVTKIVEYRVNKEEDFDGVWHVEGMSHEEILATALCVVKRDNNFSGAEIEFRRFLYEDEGNILISSTPQGANRPTDTMGGGDVRPLGRLKTLANRVIVFPNSHIHRLSSMYSSDGNDAVRRIVVFWLVNPERPIVSTANVSPQQEKITLAEALRNRLALMAERKLHKESFEEREVFLCEH